MNDDFDPKPLCAAYDRGRLVPFIGSGMSMPACVDWETFVCNLEIQSSSERLNSGDAGPHGDAISRAFVAMRSLRLQAGNTNAVAKAIEKAVYSSSFSKTIPAQAKALANLFWPLVCTTNYDDIYLRAKSLGNPRVLGRSDLDCHQILQHLSFPTSEVLWALQGFLAPRDPCSKISGLEGELVVGHAEYRRVANREPHFRRCFAEVFRRSSLLFLGSGLAEPYFLYLFDEIIEFTGPPAKPHFAFVEAGKVDTELMRERYHIVCMTYPKGKHGCVTHYLDEFRKFVDSSRVRPSTWGFRVRSPRHLESKDTGDDFRVVRGVLPDPRTLPENEAVALSCGRRRTQKPNAVMKESRRGEILLNPNVADDIGLPRWAHHPGSYKWLNDRTVKWKNWNKTYGIVARELIHEGPRPDLRSSDAIRVAFLESLRKFEEEKITTIHVQLLASGERQAFHPWVALIQMARAYGQWFRERRKTHCQEPLSVSLYVVLPAVVTLLQGGFIDLAEHLEDTELHIAIEVIDPAGGIERHHKFVKANAKLSELVQGLPMPDGLPKVFARPISRAGLKPVTLASIQGLTVEDYGLVSGSTLILNYKE